jgi:acetyl-CoA synthetase
MRRKLDRKTLVDAGASPAEAEAILSSLAGFPADAPSADVWSAVSRSSLPPALPFRVHRLVFDSVFSDWDDSLSPRPAWRPTPEEIAGANITALCRRTGLPSFEALRAWSASHRADFYRAVVEMLGIRFRRPPEQTVDLTNGPEAVRWFPGAGLNIVDSCFAAPPDQPAIVSQTEGGPRRTITFAELDRLSNRFANALVGAGVNPGDAIAVITPMTPEAVIAYLGTVKAGCVVVSIADSFAPAEIATRLRISGAKLAVTQDVVVRAGKTLPMYRKVVDAGASKVVAVPAGGALAAALRTQDVCWHEFLVESDVFESRTCAPDDMVNVLFSSGTTGEPKAIPWTHTTPIKCAMDGFLHHDIKAGDVVCWPTNLGWMMGPWLIFASLINRATIALFCGSPVSREFCEFVRESGVCVLGLVPSIVRAWRATGAPDGLDWSCIKVFSSTGEPSSPDDYLYLMSLARYRPVIEYCGGTEIGGGYLSGTVVQPASPSTFSTPAFGVDFYILDPEGRETDMGELFLVPPAIGLSSRLLNKNHHEVYYANTPRGPRGELLRRHGDQVKRLPGGYYRAMGRTDDTMKLGGIKVSSAEIERVVGLVIGVSETAAIAVAPEDGGPSQLVIYAVPQRGAHLDRFELRMAMQRSISSHLNPLFKVHDVILIDALPRTASNKVMHRVLRDRYEAGGPGQAR